MSAVASRPSAPHPLSKPAGAPCTRHLRSTRGTGGTRKARRVTIDRNDATFEQRVVHGANMRVFYTLKANLKVQPHEVQLGQLTTLLDGMRHEHKRREAQGLPTIVPWAEVDTLLGYTNRTYRRGDKTRARRRQRYVAPLCDWKACRRHRAGLEYIGTPVRLAKRSKGDVHRAIQNPGSGQVDAVGSAQTGQANPKYPRKPRARRRGGAVPRKPRRAQARGAQGKFLKAPATTAGPPAASLAQTPAKTAARKEPARLAVVPPDCSLPDDHEVGSADWVLEQALRSKHLAGLALVSQLGKCRTRGAWRAGFGAVAAMAPGAVRCPAALASHVSRLVHEGRAPDPRRRPGYRPMAGWGQGLLCAANVLPPG